MFKLICNMTFLKTNIEQYISHKISFLKFILADSEIHSQECLFYQCVQEFLLLEKFTFFYKYKIWIED